MIVDEPNRVVIQSDEAGGTIHIDHGVSAPPDSEVWAAIRPEKIHISREDPGREHNCLTGIVDEVAYMGDFSIYLVRLESGKIVRVTQPNLSRGNPDRILWEERVYLFWDASSPVVVTK